MGVRLPEGCAFFHYDTCWCSRRAFLLNSSAYKQIVRMNSLGEVALADWLNVQGEVNRVPDKSIPDERVPGELHCTAARQVVFEGDPIVEEQKQCDGYYSERGEFGPNSVRYSMRLKLTSGG